MYTVIRDTREQKPHIWEENEKCNGMLIKKLYPGDYTLAGYEGFLAIERKANTSELSQNVFEKRFVREMEALAQIPHAYMILEFGPEDIFSFPFNSGIPQKLWGKLKCTPAILLSRIIEYQVKYGVKVLFAGNRENSWKMMDKIFQQVSQLRRE